MNDLLDAVDALTKPTRRKIIQDNPEGPEPTRVVHVEDAPLLDQLDEAIRSNMGGTTLGASDPRTRSVMNLGAYEIAKGIAGKVNGWARMANATVDKDSLTHTLRAWHAKFIGTVHEARVESIYTREMESWAAQILDILDPPKEMDFAQNCPVCGSDCWYSKAEKTSYERPLIVRYRPADSGVVKDATGLCRACGAVWSARELAYELEQAELAREASA
jgi:hypothetical protein